MKGCFRAQFTQKKCLESGIGCCSRTIYNILHAQGRGKITNPQELYETFKKNLDICRFEYLISIFNGHKWTKMSLLNMKWLLSWIVVNTNIFNTLHIMQYCNLKLHINKSCTIIYLLKINKVRNISMFMQNRNFGVHYLGKNTKENNHTCQYLLYF